MGSLDGRPQVELVDDAQSWIGDLLVEDRFEEEVGTRGLLPIAICRTVKEFLEPSGRTDQQRYSFDKISDRFQRRPRGQE